MTLQDRFRRKPQTQTEQSRIAGPTPLPNPPTPEDLQKNMFKASAEPGRPIILSWKAKGKDLMYLLTVTGQKAGDPMWMLHSGTENESVSLWIYNTPDTELIHTLIQTAVQEGNEAPKAEIPESLRPRKEDTQDLPQTLAEGEAPLPSEEFADKYDIVSRVGHGGMGMIYKARRKENRKIVALKVLHAHLLTDQESRRRFEQEANNCKSLRHKNCIAVHEFGYSKHGQPYMTMEYVNGRPLASFLSENKRLEVPSFVNVFSQICDGLHHAHQQGVVHRDVKPSNVMILKSEAGIDQIKMIDFGIAKSHIERNSEHLTPTGNVLGSPAYIAPEQCAGADPDPRSDIYSLGCVMYEAITGRPPFLHENAIKVLLMQLSEPPPPFAQIVPHLELPEDLEAIIMRCLEKDPNARYQSAEDLGVDLWTFAATGKSDFTASQAQLSTQETGQSESAESGDAAPESDEGQQQESYAEETSATDESENYDYEQEEQAQEQYESEEYQSEEIEAEQQQEQPAQTEDEAAEPEALPAQPRMITFRFKRFRSASEMDMVWEGLNVARNIQRREVGVTIFLDLETSGLIHKPDIIAARLQLDHPTIKKLSAIQSMLQTLIRGGGVVIASERWTKLWSESTTVMPGATLASEDDIAELFISRSGNILDY